MVVGAVIAAPTACGGASGPILGNDSLTAEAIHTAAPPHSTPSRERSAVDAAARSELALEGAPHADSTAFPRQALLLGLASAIVIAVVAQRGWHRLGPLERGPELSTILLVLMACGLILAAPIGVSAVAGLAGPRPDIDRPADELARWQSILTLGALGAQLPVLLLVAIARYRAGGTPPMAAERAALLGVVACFVVWPIVGATVSIAAWARLALFEQQTEALAHESLRMIADPAGGNWGRVLALLAVIGAPIVEETLYRGIAQPLLRRLGLSAWSAIALVSIFFALAHVTVAPPPAIAGLAVLGVLFGWLRERSGGLVAPIAAHMLFNAGNILLAQG